MKAIVVMPDAARIAKRLVNHFRHKVTITELGDDYLVHMAGADVTLSPNAEALTITIVRNESTDNPERPYDLERVKFVLTDHINRMANQTFDYEWLQSVT